MGLDAMLYLCKSCYAYTKQQGIFFDRGTAIGPDFNLVALTLDGAWHDLDLSAIVPAGVHLVLIRTRLDNQFVGTEFRFRNKGITTLHNTARYYMVLGNTELYVTFIVGIDSNGFVQYFGSAAGNWVGDITVGGWSY